jgi:hypothetical protein
LEEFCKALGACLDKFRAGHFVLELPTAVEEKTDPWRNGTVTDDHEAHREADREYWADLEKRAQAALDRQRKAGSKPAEKKNSKSQKKKKKKASAKEPVHEEKKTEATFVKDQPVWVVDEDDEDPDAGTQVWPAYFMQQAYSETKRAKKSTIKLIPGQWRLRFDTGQTYNYATEDIFTTPEQAYEAIHARTYVFL